MYVMITKWRPSSIRAKIERNVIRTNEETLLLPNFMSRGRLALTDLFDKKVKQITVKFSFPTALDPTEIPQPSADWNVLGKDKEVGAPVVTDSVIQDYQKAKYAGLKGQYRMKAYRMFSSRRTVSVKILKDGNNPRRIYIYQGEHA